MDLSTTYLGLKLKHPIVPSASPLTSNLSSIRRLEDAGAPAVVMYSLFEEQIDAESRVLDHYLTNATDSYGEALSYFPQLDRYNVGPQDYLNLIYMAKRSVDIPVIGSLNGVSVGGWTEYARHIEEAGADALELNIYYVATDSRLSSAEVEDIYLDVVRQVKSTVSIPVAVKVGPYFTAFASMARRLQEAGADGLVLFNRFYQPDFDLERLEVVPHLVLSTQFAMRVPLRWVAILYGRVPVDLAITSGVRDHTDVLKGMMAGANVTMMAGELLRHGEKRIGEIVQAMTQWMEEHEYESVEQMQGSMSQKNVAEPAAFERANYMKVLQSWRQDPTGAYLR